MSRPRHVVSSDAPKAVGPYGQGVIASGLLFSVGVVGNDPATSRLVPGGVVAETAQAIRNLEAILRAGGSGFDRIVKATVFLCEVADEASVIEAWERAVREPRPAWTAVAVDGMPLGASVEIECIAVADGAIVRSG